MQNSRAYVIVDSETETVYKSNDNNIFYFLGAFTVMNNYEGIVRMQVSFIDTLNIICRLSLSLIMKMMDIILLIFVFNLKYYIIYYLNWLSILPVFRGHSLLELTEVENSWGDRGLEFFGKTVIICFRINAFNNLLRTCLTRCRHKEFWPTRKSYCCSSSLPICIKVILLKSLCLSFIS